MTDPGGTSPSPSVHRLLTFARGVLLAILLLCGGVGLAQAQTVTDVQPRSGAPGTAIRLTGTNLGADGTTVRVAGVDADITGVSGGGTVLTATVSTSAAPGPADVTVNGIPAPGTFSVISGGSGYFYSENPNLDALRQGDIALCALDSDLGLDLIGAGLASGFPDSGFSLNDGSGTFGSLGGLTNVSNASIDCGDFDGDGDLDLAVIGAGSIGEGRLQVYENDGTGVFSVYADGGSSTLVPVNEGSVDWADIDGDGDLDLLVTGFANDGGLYLEPVATLYENTGSGFSILGADIAPNISTSDLTAVASGDADFGDLDNDGDLDLVLTGAREFGSRVATIFTNDGTGVFSPSNTEDLTPVDSSATALGDMDNDGDLDLVIAGRNASNVPTTTVYRQNSDGNFEVLEADGDGDTSGLPGVKNGDVAWGDVDGDGDLDLFLTGSGTTGVYENDIANGNGFQLLTDDGTGTTATFPDLSQSAGAWGDVDGDGDLDLAVMGTDGSAGQVSVYDNAAPPAIDVTLSGSSILGSVVDAGRTLPNADLTTSLSITNTGTETPLEITGVSGTTPEFSSETSVLDPTISPGGSAPLDLTLNASETGAYQATITLTSTDPNQSSVSFTIEGRVVEGKATEVRPRSAPPGSTVRVYGAGFTSDTEVTFGSAAPVSPDNVYTSGTAMDVTVPSGLSGPVPVSVSFPGGTTLALPDAFTALTGGPGFFSSLPVGLTNVLDGIVDWIDIDGDGDLDLFVTGRTGIEGPPVAAVYENDGTNGFTLLNPDGDGNTAGLQGVTAAASDWGDYDNDGDLDLILTGQTGDSTPSATLYEADLGGTGFTTVSANLQGVVNGSAHWGDVDGDGDLDLLITGGQGFEGYTATLYRNGGGGTFSVVNDDGNGNTSDFAPVQNSAAAWADVDGDGDLDLAIAGLTTSSNGEETTVYLNDGSGAFSVFDDLDEDGSTDDLTGIQRGDLAWGDYDGDGDPDLVVTGQDASLNNTVTLYENTIANETGFVNTSTSLTGVRESQTEWIDVDGDGDLDLYVSGRSESASSATVYTNDGGSFSPLNPDATGTSAALATLIRPNAAWGDSDGDGDLDVAAVGAMPSSPSPTPATLLYENTSPPPPTIFVSPDGNDGNDGSSWGSAYRTLQKALQEAAAPLTTEIWVEAGRYTPDDGPNVTSGDPAASFPLTSDVDVYGGFAGTESNRDARDPQAHRTILSGDLDGDDTDPDGDGVIATAADIQGTNSYNIVTGQALAAPVRMSGFTLTGGDAHSTVSTAQSQGGALHLRNASLDGVGLRFIGNRARGQSGSGGAVFAGTGTNLNLANAVLAGNTATTEGSAADASGLVLANSLVLGNEGTVPALTGGGSLSLSSVTATQNEGPVAAAGSQLTVENSILWANNSGGAQLQSLTSSTSINLNSVLLQGGTTTGVDLSLGGGLSSPTSILDQDPQFVDPTGADNVAGTLDDNLRLPASSPAFDAGDATLLLTDALDLDGDDNISESVPVDLRGTPRVINGTLDLGALETNPTPTITPLSDQTTSEDTPLLVSFTIGDLNDALSDLALSAQTSNQALVPDGNLTLSGTGSDRTLTVTPRPDSNSAGGTGPTDITVSVSDGTTTTSITFQVTVASVNDVPVAANDAASTPEDTGVTVDVLANDADVEGALDSASVAVTTPPTQGSASVNASAGTITYTPTADFSGADSLRYTVADPSGAVSNEAKVFLTVTAVNDAPTLSAKTDTTIDEDTVLDPLSVTIGDPESAASDLSLTATSSNTDLIPDANLSLSGTGKTRSLSLSPRPDSAGSATITLTVNDGSLTTSTDVTVTVAPVNDAPVATADDVTTTEDTDIRVDVLANDTDVEGPLDTTSVAVTTAPASGTAQVNTSDGTITYTPAPGFSGTDQLSYTVADPSGASSDPALVTLEVQAVELQATVDTVRAGTVQTSQDSSVSVVVTNTGAVNVSGLSALLSGSAEEDYQTLGLPSGTLAPGEQASLPVRFAPSATGRRLATLAVSTTEGAQVDIPLLGTGVSVTAASDAAVQGESTTVDVTLNGGFVPTETAELYARPGGGDTYSAVALNTTDATSTTQELEATVPASLVTPSGVDYYAVLSDGASTVTVPAGGPSAAAARPLHLPVTFADLTPPLTFAPDTYGMVSIPALTGDGALAALTAAYGEYDPGVWRLLRWNAPASTYEEPPQVDSLAPGMGAWLVTEGGTPFTISGTSADASSPRRIPLTPGWNQIGTPFGFAVPWDTVRTVSGTPVDGPVGYRDGTYRYNVPTLQPWAGYFVFNSTASRDTLVVPPVGAPDAESTTNGPAALAGTGLGPSANDAAKSTGDGAYTIELQAHTDGTTHPVWIGLHPDAKAGRDALDFAQAPPVRPSVRLSILESLDGRAVRHAGSFKPFNTKGRTWTLQLSRAAGARSPKTVRLHLQEAGTVPTGQQQYLLDLDREQRLVPGQALSLEPGETRSLKLILGTESYAKQASDGISLEAFQNELRGNAPNPFDGATTLSYVLATDQEVTLSIYNVLGQRVRTLVQDRKKRGLHRVTWDGTTEYGRPAGSGVYFYRIEGEDFTATQKMVLVR